MIEIVFALLIGWALGIATAVFWWTFPRRRAPLGSPSSMGGYQPKPSAEGHIPMNPPQGTGSARGSRVEIHLHGSSPDPEEFRKFREHIEKYLDQAEREPPCPVT